MQARNFFYKLTLWCLITGSGKSHVINQGKKKLKIDVTTSHLRLPTKKLQVKRLRTLGWTNSSVYEHPLYMTVEISSVTCCKSMFPPHRCNISRLHGLFYVSHGFRFKIIVGPQGETFNALVYLSTSNPILFNISSKVMSEFSISIYLSACCTASNTFLASFSTDLSSLLGLWQTIVLCDGGFGNPKQHAFPRQQ